MKKNVVKSLFLSSIFVLTVLILVIAFAARNRSSKLNVVFVNIPDFVREGISAQILRKTERPPVFKTLSSDSLDIQKLAKRTDIIFSYNGEFGTEISAFAKEIPSSILQTVPENFLQTQNALPILLDHYGIFYYNSAKQKASASYAFDFPEFELYLQKTKSVTEFPLFVSGGNDLRLLAFVGTLTESVFGQEAYTEFLNALKNYSTMENLLQVKISSDKTVKTLSALLLTFRKKHIFIRHGLEQQSKISKITLWIQGFPLLLPLSRISVLSVQLWGRDFLWTECRFSMQKQGTE